MSFAAYDPHPSPDTAWLDPKVSATDSIWSIPAFRLSNTLHVSSFRCVVYVYAACTRLLYLERAYAKGNEPSRFGELHPLQQGSNIISASPRFEAAVLLQKKALVYSCWRMFVFQDQ